MAEKSSEIVIQFQQPPHSMFNLDQGQEVNGNALAFSPTDALRHANNDNGGTIYTVDQVSGASGAPDDSLTYLGFPALTDPRPSAMEANVMAVIGAIQITSAHSARLMCSSSPLPDADRYSSR